MNVASLAGSFYRAEDIADPLVRVISSITTTTLDQQVRVVLGFQNDPFKLALNRTNLQTCIDAWGPETDAWQGRRIQLHTEPTKYMGRDTRGVRVICDSKTAPVPVESANEDLPF